jgi:hypothetical protein
MVSEVAVVHTLCPEFYRFLLHTINATNTMSPPNRALQPTPLRVEGDRAFFESWFSLDCVPVLSLAARLSARTFGVFSSHSCGGRCHMYFLPLIETIQIFVMRELVHDRIS